MSLGISSYTYGWAIGVPGYPPARPMGLLNLLDKAAELDVRVVQVADNLPLDQLSSDRLDVFEGYASQLGVRIEVGTRGIAPDHLRTYLHLAQRLHSPIVRVVIDTADHQPSEHTVVETLKALMPEFERARVTLAIENHDRFTTRTLADVIERIDSPAVGICLDTANSFGALEGPEVVIDTLKPWVVNLHLKDFAIFRASHHMGFTIEGRPAGQGLLNVPWLLKKLQAPGPDPGRKPISAAILELWTPPEATLAKTVIKEDAWAVASVQYLRQFIPD